MLEFASVKKVVVEGASGEECLVDVDQRSAGLFHINKDPVPSVFRYTRQPSRPLTCMWDIKSQEKRYSRPRKAHQPKGARFGPITNVGLVPTREEVKAIAHEGCLHWTQADVDNNKKIWRERQDHPGLFGETLDGYEKLKEASDRRVARNNEKEQHRLRLMGVPQQQALAVVSTTNSTATTSPALAIATISLNGEEGNVGTAHNNQKVVHDGKPDGGANADMGPKGKTGWEKAKIVALMGLVGGVAVCSCGGFVLGGLTGMLVAVIAAGVVGITAVEVVCHKERVATSSRRRSNPQAPAFM